MHRPIVSYEVCLVQEEEEEGEEEEQDNKWKQKGRC